MSQHNDDRRDRLSSREPEDLTDREKLLLLTYRTQKLEERVDGLFKAMWTIAGGIIVGVIVFILTQRPAVAHAALALLAG